MFGVCVLCESVLVMKGRLSCCIKEFDFVIFTMSIYLESSYGNLKDV